jgi:type VI secretion system protein ImpG
VGRDPFHYEIFSLDRAGGFSSAAGGEIEIPSFYAFAPGAVRGVQGCYLKRLRGSVVDDREETYVSFVDPRGEPAAPPVETVSFAITASNRELPKALQVGDVREPTDSSPAFVTFQNITKPTASVTPPLDGDLQWRLISHLSLNYTTLASAEALREVFRLYNFQLIRDRQAERGNALRLEGIHRVESRASARLAGGTLIRGTEVAMELLEDHFAGEGDLFLFATLVNEFLSLHATLNGFVRLTVRGAQTGEEWTWPHRTGRDPL